MAEVAVDGQLLWVRMSTGPTIKDVAADAHGGLILVLDDTFGTSTPRPQHVQRIDGATGRVSWEYFSDDGTLSEVAVHPDGTIFVTDEDFDPSLYRLIPQASGGLFVGQTRGGSDVLRMGPTMLRMGPSGDVSEIVPLMGTLMASVDVMEVDYAVTETVGRALIKRYTGEPTRPYEVYDLSFDPTAPLPGGTTLPPSTDPHVRFRFISTGGGVYLSGHEGGMFGANDTRVARGLWAGLGSSAFLALGRAVDVSQPSSYLQGSTDATNATRRRTIAVKCRPVDQSPAWGRTATALWSS